MARRVASLLIAVALVALLALLGSSRWARGGAEGATATASTARYTVHLALERGLIVGDQQAVVEIRDRDDNPVVAAEVGLTPVMVEMGHLLPTLPAPPGDDPGSYRAQGEIFSMPGAWNLDIRVRTAQGTETARFRFELG